MFNLNTCFPLVFPHYILPNGCNKKIMVKQGPLTYYQASIIKRKHRKNNHTPRTIIIGDVVYVESCYCIIKSRAQDVAV